MKKQKIKFSVLIAVYYKEKAENFERALKSITSDQTLLPDEIVLIKDGPLTRALDLIVAQYNNKYINLFKITELNRNNGLGNALNIGLRNCSFELVARMDSDDIAKPKRFEKQIEYFENNRETDVLGTYLEEFESNEDMITGIRKTPEFDDEIKNQLKKLSIVNHATVMYKKSKVIETGGYSQDFPLEDYVLWVKMAINGNKFATLQESYYLCRSGRHLLKRRGGVSLLINDVKMHYSFYKMRFINKYEMVRNIFIWGVYRLAPWQLRYYLKQLFLRGVVSSRQGNGQNIE